MNNRFQPYAGPPSRRHPNLYKGREQAGGYLARNAKPTSSNSPSFKGRVWVPMMGWFWVSGWTGEGRNGQYLSLKLNPVSDEEADKYCQPREQGGAPRHQPPTQTYSHPTQGYDGNDIPF